MAATPNTTAPAECPVCSGTGWETVALPGKSSRVKRCECRLVGRNGRLLEQARIPARYKDCTLSDFETHFEDAHPSLAEARLAAGRFVEEYPLEKTGLLFIGPVGIGKTHLAVGIIQELVLSKGISCLFCDYRELLREIINSYQPNVETTELEVLRPIFEAEVLVLDELGAVKVNRSEWMWDTVSYILNYRYNSKKTTIITTNLADLPSIKKEERRPSKVHLTEAATEAAEKSTRKDTLGDRITDAVRSRLHEMCRIVELTGNDFRIGPGSARQRVHSNIPSERNLDEIKRLRPKK